MPRYKVEDGHYVEDIRTDEDGTVWRSYVVDYSDDPGADGPETEEQKVEAEEGKA